MTYWFATRALCYGYGGERGVKNNLMSNSKIQFPIFTSKKYVQKSWPMCIQDDGPERLRMFPPYPGYGVCFITLDTIRPSHPVTVESGFVHLATRFQRVQFRIKNLPLH